METLWRGGLRGLSTTDIAHPSPYKWDNSNHSSDERRQMHPTAIECNRLTGLDSQDMGILYSRDQCYCAYL